MMPKAEEIVEKAEAFANYKCYKNQHVIPFQLLHLSPSAVMYDAEKAEEALTKKGYPANAGNYYITCQCGKVSVGMYRRWKDPEDVPQKLESRRRIDLES